MEAVLRTDPTIGGKTVEQAMTTIKKLAVIPVAMGSRRADLLALRQERGESARIFALRIQGKSSMCAFNAPCGAVTKCTTRTNECEEGECTNSVDFTEVSENHNS